MPHTSLLAAYVSTKITAARSRISTKFMVEFKPSPCRSHLPGGMQEEEEDCWQNEVIAAHSPPPALVPTPAPKAPAGALNASAMLVSNPGEKPSPAL